MRAISALGSTNDERALDVLREIAMGTDLRRREPDRLGHPRPRQPRQPARRRPSSARSPSRGQNLKARTHAIELLGAPPRRATSWTSCSASTTPCPRWQVKKYVARRASATAKTRAPSPSSSRSRARPRTSQLRAQAIRSIPNRGEEQDLDVLLPLYDSERDNDLKNHLLQAIGHYQNRRAYQKLSRSSATAPSRWSAARRPSATSAGAKTPQVMKFLEGCSSRARQQAAANSAAARGTRLRPSEVTRFRRAL